MAKMELSTRNFRAVAANFQAQVERVQVKARKVVKDSGKRVQKRAKELCPVDTGFLQSKIRLEYSEGGFSYSVGLRDEDFHQKTFRGQKRQRVGLVTVSTANGETADVNYGILQEFGTRHMKAQPFLFPARDEEAPTFKKELSDALKAGRTGRKRSRGRR